MNRREFLQTASALAAAAAVAPSLPIGAIEKPAVTASRLPRWRGFNLLAKFVKHPGDNPPFQESDFALLAEWGFVELWKEAGWGWSLWEFRGSFGVLDSHRGDVDYEDFRGHKLDRQMLTVLQKG